MYHQILDRGKKILISPDKESLPALKREFGAQAKQFLLGCGAGSAEEARKLLQLMEVG